MRQTILLLSGLALLLLAPAQLAAQQARVLFIRGGFGTGGFLEGGANEQLSDIKDFSTDPGNHGFGELNLLLRSLKYTVSQVIEGPFDNNTPIDLAALPLSDYDIVVFGSNNADYDAESAQLLADWVCSGGAALFISDANWGQDWGDAPSSDQTFLDHFDLIMNQDKGTYVLSGSAGDFLVPGHAILAGSDGTPGSSDDINAFDGEGVSPLTVTHQLPGADPQVVVRAKGQMKLNDAPGSGTTVNVGPDDGSLVTLEFGLGRVAGHFDRNTFFNENGAGTSLHLNDNTQYATNLFAWLANAGGSYGTGCPDVNGITPQLTLTGLPTPGGVVKLKLSGAPGGSFAALLIGTGKAQGLSLGLCNLLVWPLIDPQIFFPLGGSGPGAGSLTFDIFLPPGLPEQLFTLQAFIPNAGPGGTPAATNGVSLFVH